MDPVLDPYWKQEEADIQCNDQDNDAARLHLLPSSNPVWATGSFCVVLKCSRMDSPLQLSTQKMTRARILVSSMKILFPLILTPFKCSFKA